MPAKIQIHKEVITASVTLDEVRRAWAIISNNPRVTVRQLAEIMNTSRTGAHRLVKFLQRTRYIKQKKAHVGHKVIIPFVEIQE